MPISATNEQDQHAIKAEERRRRVASMLMNTNGTESSFSAPSNEVRHIARTPTPSVHGTAVAVKHQDGPSATPRWTKAEQLALVTEKEAALSSPPAAAVAPAPPTSLTDMEIKASARQGHVSRLLGETDTATQVPNALSDMEAKAAARGPVQPGAAPIAHGALSEMEQKARARQGHMTRLLEPLQTQEDGVRQKLELAQEQFGSGENAIDEEEGDRKPVATLLELQHPDAKQGPAAIPDPPTNGQKEGEQLLEYHSAQAPPTVHDGTTSPKSDTMHEIRAEVVDELHDRQEIVQQAQADLIAKAVVASSVAADDQGKLVSQESLRLWMCVAVSFLTVVGVILAGVCGSGLCAGPAVDPVERANGIAALINDVTLRETPVVMLSDGRGSSTAAESDVDTFPEEEALLFLIENDVLQLHPDKDSERLIQRYALAVLWFTNGPWTDTLAIQGVEVVNGDPLRNWFVGRNECLWTGVVCVDGEVQEVSLPAKGMVGAVPADLTLLTGLKTLVLDQNELTGTIPSFLTKFTALERLELHENNLTGPGIPTFASQLTSLKEYIVAGNELTGEFPDSLASMTQLEVLSVGGNLLVGTVPNFLADFSSLRGIYIGFNDLSGTIPSGLFQLTNLEELRIPGDSFTGNYNLADLQGLSKLTSLALAELNLPSGLEDDMVDWWPNMKVLALVRCGLEGTLPVSFGAWEKLHELDVTGNALTGTLPAAALAAWTNMDIFAMGFNDFSGTLPTEIGFWSDTTSFDIRHNMLTGTLPTEVGVMAKLIQFLVTDNQFTGAIPDEVLNFNDAFTWLDLNNFSGVAPYCADNPGVVSHRVDCDSVACDCCGDCL